MANISANICMFTLRYFYFIYPYTYLHGTLKDAGLNTDEPSGWVTVHKVELNM